MKKITLTKLILSTGLLMSTLALLAAPMAALADNGHRVSSRRDFRAALNNIYRADSYIFDRRYGRAEDEIYSAIDHLENDGGSEARRAIRYLNLTLDYMGDDDRRARDYLNEAETICEDNS